MSGRYLLQFTRRSGWHSEALGKAIEILLEGNIEGVVHAGAGHPNLGSAFADWLEVARTLSIHNIERSFYPASYINRYQDPFPQEMDPAARADHFLRASARVGIKHLNLLSAHLDHDTPLAATWNNVCLIDPLSAYHLFILNGKIPDGVLKLKAELLTANNLAQEISHQLKQRNEEVLDQEHLIIELRSRQDWLELELVNTRKTLSWRLTRPLRSISSAYQRLFKSTTHPDSGRTLFDKTKAKISRMLLAAVHRAQAWIVSRSSSPHNLLAVQALSARRFNVSFTSIATQSDRIELPNLDISVVSYNSGKWIDNFMMSLLNQNYPLDQIHLVVVDHGSTDSTLDQIKQWQTRNGSQFARFEIIQHPNLGFGAGHHRAIATGHSDYCLVTNLDLEFLPQSIVNVVKAALSDKTTRVASWEMRQIPYEHPKYYDPVTLETNWSSHACILMARSAYEGVGGYDDRIFMYAEDVEMSYRFRSHGYALKYVPHATVRHFSYEQAGEVKPVQFLGSILGNNYIRMRYGRKKDVVIGLLMYLMRFVFSSPFAGARRGLFINAPKLLQNSSHFLRGKGPHAAYFPLRGYDYEMIRDGAFWPVQELPSLEQLPRATIITRTYQGRGALLTQAILSVFNQTYPHIELIVVEDGGETQKALVEKMAAIAPEHIQIHFLANPKLGRSAAGNRALSQATGQFMMFLDDDDLLFADHLEILSKPMLKDESLAACYALAYEVSTEMADDKSNYSEFNFQTPPIMHQEWDYEVLRHHNFIPIQAILFRRFLFEKHGGFDTELDQLEDWNLWLRYGHQQRFQFIPKTTSYYRTPANVSVRSDRHQLLHDAYELAQSRAMQALKNNTTL
jgi:GT2 family glycosyltransferase